jgi:hypothetical protein
MRGGNMTRLTWNAVGERTFETGVDRGILFVEDSYGVPWNGLISVVETPTGGEITPYYIDGIRYLNHVASEEFEATIEAFTYPENFAECDGTVQVENGLFASQQFKKTFGMAYRTIVGDDIRGVANAYKIHLVYNATAEPTERPNTTMGAEIEPSNFSWHIVTKPSIFEGYRPIAHLIIDSRKTPPELLESIENDIYGTFYTGSFLPSVSEMIDKFKTYDGPSIIDGGETHEPHVTTLDGGSP